MSSTLLLGTWKFQVFIFVFKSIVGFDVRVYKFACLVPGIMKRQSLFYTAGNYTEPPNLIGHTGFGLRALPIAEQGAASIDTNLDHLMMGVSEIDGLKPSQL
jgi:hypothetical protein